MKKNLHIILDKFSVSNLTPYVVVLTGAVSALDFFNIIPGIGRITPDVLSGNQWWNIFFYPFNLKSSGGFGLIITLYVMWAFGMMLESHMQRIKYNLYIFSALILITLGTIFLPINIGAYYLEMSIFLGCATVAGNMQILLFFVIPIRMKWLGIIGAAMVTVSTVMNCIATGSLIPVLEPAIGLANYFIFFGISSIKGHRIQTQNKIRMKKFEKAEVSIHRCSVCGMTEKDEPQMDFRFCVDCSDHEYCRNHLHNHEHR